MVLHLGMRIAPANLLISATFSAAAPRAEHLRDRVIALAERATSRAAFLAGLEDIARAERVVLEMGPTDRDEVAFYLWEGAEHA
jgi:hypothetical protein